MIQEHVFNMRVKMLPGALEADLTAHWCQHPVYLTAKLNPQQPSHRCQLHILIPSGLYHLNHLLRTKADPIGGLLHLLPACKSSFLLSSTEQICLQATTARLCEGIWMVLAPGCCHGVDLFTVHQPTDFKQRSTRFGCHISVSVIIQRTHFHWVI